MHYQSEHIRNPQVITNYSTTPVLGCDWQELCRQLMQQWPKVTREDLSRTGPNCRRIAILIQNKYGISHQMVENYLRNFERTMPLQ